LKKGGKKQRLKGRNGKWWGHDRKKVRKASRQEQNGGTILKKTMRQASEINHTTPDEEKKEKRGEHSGR